MRDKWLISDLHLGHTNILGFTIEDGRKLRPGFDTIDQMHQCIFDSWTKVVKPGDKVYVLGDIAFGKAGLLAMKELGKLAGQKRAVLGNHDKFQPKHYAEVFKEIYGFRRLDRFWLSHAPVHPCTIGERADGNIHGHMHAYEVEREIVDDIGIGELVSYVPDTRYFNVACERVNYTPINLEEIRSKICVNHG